MPHSYSAKTAEIIEAQEDANVLFACACEKHRQSANYWLNMMYVQDDAAPHRLHGPGLCMLPDADEVEALLDDRD